jgi:hypothetical protein
MKNTVYIITNKEKNINGIISNIDENNISILWEDKKEEKLSNDELNSLLDSDDYDVEETEIEEDETPAQKSIQTHKTADATDEVDGNPKTKLDWIRAIVGNLADMDVTTLAGLQDKVLKQIGGEAERAGTANDTDKNRSSIQMKPSGAQEKSPLYTESVKLQKEEMDNIFGETELTEDAKLKISTLFETSIALRLTEEVLKIQEIYDKKLLENIESLTSELIENIDSYFNHVTEEWIKENQVAIESTLKTELTEEFISGLKNLFNEHYIEIPEERVDVYENLVSNFTEVENNLNVSENKLIESKKEINNLRKEIIILENSSSLTLPQKEKFKTLIEGVDFDNEEEYKKKILIIKEGFLNKNKDSNIISESFSEESNNSLTSSDPAMSSYVNAIRKNKKFSDNPF